MTKERIEKAVEIIEYAIANQVSVKEASVKCGMSDTYVKNTKAVVFDKYENGTLDDDLFNLFNDAYGSYTNVTGFATNTRTEPNIEESQDKPKDLPNVPDFGEKETFEQKDDNNAEYTWTAGRSYPSDHVRTLDDLIAATKVDLDIWKVARHVVNKWDVTSWKSGEPETVQNWQVKAWLERDLQVVRERQVGEIFQEMSRDYTPPVFPFIPRPNSAKQSIEDKNLLEISIFDLHIGKLAWGGETFENYDVKIARKRFLDSIQKLVQRASGFNFERILFPVGNDFFNSDTMENTTTKGTQQDEDLRWQKTFRVGVRLLVDAINMLRETGVPVDVLVIPGNHDFERSFYMGSYLEAWFKNDAAVNINNHASPRKYYRYGNTLLGLTHGSEEKEASLPLLMATDVESKPMWSDTKFHEWHLGHIHRKRTVKYEINKSRPLNEDLGVTVRYLSSLTGTEEWHHKKGFVGSTKAADGFVWNHEFGLVAHLNTNLIID
jgi:hypothetical protein